MFIYQRQRKVMIQEEEENSGTGRTMLKTLTMNLGLEKC